MKTLTSIGIQKIGQRFVDSVDHADYTLNGVPQTAEPFRRFVQGASATGLHKNTGQGALYSLQI